jgi:cell division control protein 6
MVGLSAKTTFSNMQIENIFSHYIEKQSLFKNKNILTSSFIPEKILHRDDEIKQISQILAPILKDFQTSNIFIYGKCGTGKTMCTKYVLKHLKEAEKNINKSTIKTVYINCKMKRVADTEYRMLAQLLKEFGDKIPDTGLPTDVLYGRFFDALQKEKNNVILVLDEIDMLCAKTGDDFLYNLTRINTELKESHITIIGITNDLSFKEKLDARIRSSLSEQEIIFKPYDALQIKDILLQRIENGFIDGAINEDVIACCAALAAQEHGDARKALDLLVVAGEVAERHGDIFITQKHLELAEEKIDIDRIVETVRMQPKQSQAVLYAILRQNKKDNGEKWVDNRLLTGDVFSEYAKICNTSGLKILTQRRVSDLITELDMLGIISTHVISKGRYGRTREIAISLEEGIKNSIETLIANRLF